MVSVVTEIINKAHFPHLNMFEKSKEKDKSNEKMEGKICECLHREAQFSIPIERECLKQTELLYENNHRIWF